MDGSDADDGGRARALALSAEITQQATADLAGIAAMLRVIRDHVAPRISDRDLRQVNARRSAHLRIFPHPTLRRATAAAGSAYAAMRRVQECVAAARAPAPPADAPALAAALWLDRAREQMRAIARARSAIAREIGRIRTGVATIVDAPPPAPPPVPGRGETP